jgi:hypothetical protein
MYSPYILLWCAQLYLFKLLHAVQGTDSIIQLKELNENMTNHIQGKTAGDLKPVPHKRLLSHYHKVKFLQLSNFDYTNVN